MDRKAFKCREDRLRDALRDYFDRYDDANNANEMLGRLMILSNGALDPNWTRQFCRFLFAESEGGA